MAFKKLYSNKYLQPAIHILFWGLVIISPYLFRNPSTWKGFSNWQYKLMINNAILAGLFYFNAFYLYPFVYKRKGILLYLVSVVASVALLMYVSYYIDSLLMLQPRHLPDGPPPGPGHGPGPGPNLGPDSGPGAHHRRMEGKRLDKSWFFWYFTNSITYIFIVGISISYRIIMDNSRLEKIRKERENENLKTELSFLRSQVSPHFIFNILNNMVSLARKKSDMLEPSLIELSKLMRYMLYENDDERVSLDREVDYLRSYIALQLLRFGDDVSISFNPPENIGIYRIEPMLLTPFVENAFKHGVGMVENPMINILLEVNAETGWLDFKVMNSIAPRQDSKDKDSGIGLTNVRRRLELLYKDGYTLDISQTESIFVANLKLKLK